MIEYEKLETIIKDVNDFIRISIINNNRDGNLIRYLESIGYDIGIKMDHSRHISDNKMFQKVVIIGSTNVQEKHILAIFEKHGISKKRIELVLDYEQAEKYKYSKFEYTDKYGAVLFGPIPHSTMGKGDFDSIITKMINEQEKYPPTFKLEANNELKITKTNLNEKIEYLISTDIIRPDF